MEGILRGRKMAFNDAGKTWTLPGPTGRARHLGTPSNEMSDYAGGRTLLCRTAGTSPRGAASHVSSSRLAGCGALHPPPPPRRRPRLVSVLEITRTGCGFAAGRCCRLNAPVPAAGDWQARTQGTHGHVLSSTHRAPGLSSSSSLSHHNPSYVLLQAISCYPVP